MVVVSVTRLSAQPDVDEDSMVGEIDVLLVLMPLVVWLCGC